MSSGPFRLDGGEFEPDTWPTRYSVGEGRRRTMKAMVAVEPEVLSSLLDDPTWAEQLKGDKPPAFDKAKAASIRWRERWRLFESWCWEWACDEIRMRGAKARGDKLIFTEMRLAPAPLQHESFRFEPPAWDPAHEQWKDYLARVSDSFVEYRNEYRMRVEGAAKQARYVRTAQIWNDDQFFWLARRHLHAEKYVDMARNGIDLTPKQISVAVRRLAQYVGFHHKAYPIRVNRQRNIGARGAMFPKFDTDFEPRAQSKDNGSTMSGTSSTFEIRKRRADRCGAMKEACVGATGDLQNHDHDPQTTVAKACSMGARLKVIYRRIADLHLDSRNPRVHSQKQIRQIAKSIEACGFNVPMLVDESSRVVAGHGRFLACQQLACSEVPTIALEHLSEAQTRAFMIADNRLTENSSWDDRFLAEQLKELSTLQKGSTPRRRKCASG